MLGAVGPRFTEPPSLPLSSLYNLVLLPDAMTDPKNYYEMGCGAFERADYNQAADLLTQAVEEAEAARQPDPTLPQVLNKLAEAARGPRTTRKLKALLDEPGSWRKQPSVTTRQRLPRA
jgi:hypothetical protein